MISATSKFTAGNTASVLAAIRAAAARACEATANGVLQQAQVLVPIDTGALYESGHVETAPDVPAADVVFDSNHAIYPEFGTYKMRAQPYLRPAMDAAHGVAMDNMAEEVRKVLA